MNRTDLMDKTDQCANLLTRAFHWKDKFDALASATGAAFNIFTILDRETDEVKTHSAMIAELLNPDGLHGRGAVFSRLFFEQLGIEINGGLCCSQVDTEVDVGEYGRIDILFKTNSQYVVIENKIHAPDQSGQLERYVNFAKDNKDDYAILYLTLDGSDPDLKSLGELADEDTDKIQYISYKSHIIDWLDECIKETATAPQIRELLVQYQNLLRKLTGRQDGGFIMKLMELLTEEHDGVYNMELVPYLYQALKNLYINKEWEFWKDLEKRLTKKQDRHMWYLEHLKGVESEDEACDVNLEVIQSKYNKPQRSHDYGTTFRIRRIRSDEESKILLRIELDSSKSKVCFGFILAEQNIWMRKDAIQITGIENILEGLGMIPDEPDPWWLGYRYLNINFDTDILTNNNKFMRKYIKDSEVLEKVAEKIEKVVDGLVNSLRRTDDSPES